MELTIGILENDMALLDQLNIFLHQWCEKNNEVISIEVYTSYKELNCSGKADFDIIFLHILPGTNEGMEAAIDLRRRQYRGGIVFLSSTPKYVFQGYEVRALNYLLLPFQYEEIKKCLDIVWKNKIGLYYYYTYRDEVLKIPFSHILYFSSNNHHTQICLHENQKLKEIQQSKALKTIRPYLPSEFQSCFRGIVINMRHLVMINKNELLLTGQIKLPVSNTYYELIRKYFIDKTP